MLKRSRFFCSVFESFKLTLRLYRKQREEEQETDLEKWVYMLKNMSRLDQIPTYLNKRIFQKIFQIAEISNLTAEERAMYEASLKENLSDSGLLRSFKNRQFEKWGYGNVLASAMRESKLEREIKGAEQKSHEVVCNLILQTDFDDNKIASLATVAVEYVQKVRQGLAKTIDAQVIHTTHAKNDSPA